jgi:hypothetical protein
MIHGTINKDKVPLIPTDNPMTRREKFASKCLEQFAGVSSDYLSAFNVAMNLPAAKLQRIIKLKLFVKLTLKQ